MVTFDLHTLDITRSKVASLTHNEVIEVHNTPGEALAGYSHPYFSATTFSVTLVSLSTLDAATAADEAEAAYDALWESAFANSQDLLDRMADEIQAKYVAGLTEEFDPDTDPDLQ